MYKGKRKDNGEWVKGWFIGVGEYSYIVQRASCYYQNPTAIYLQEHFEVIPETVGQFTGLKDNKDTGEELYHKDIVWVTKHYMGDSFCPAQIGVIEWVDDGWTVVNKDGDYLCELWDYTYNYCGGKRGTIHSNPELLNA